MRCPACKKNADFGHVCSIEASTEERVERLETETASLSARYDALKAEVAAVYGVTGGRPGDTPSQAAQRALSDTRSALLQEILVKLREDEKNLRLERKETRRHLATVERDSLEADDLAETLVHCEGRLDMVRLLVGRLEGMQ